MTDGVAASVDLGARALAALRACGAGPQTSSSSPVAAISPIDGEELFDLEATDCADAATSAATAFAAWRQTPASARAAFLETLGRSLAERRAELADLVQIETGKPAADAMAEVEVAVQACGRAADAAPLVSPPPGPGSTPAGHFETRSPLGPVAIVGSFETPLLDWAAAAPDALACGCSVVWGAAAPLVATAVAAIVENACRAVEIGIAGLHTLVLGGTAAADLLSERGAFELVESPRTGDLNVAIVCRTGDLKVAADAVSVATVAGGGSSPAALRLLLVDERVSEELERRLIAAFEALGPDNPSKARNSLPPLRDLGAFRRLLDATQVSEAEGGLVLSEGGRHEVADFPEAFYAVPTLVRAAAPLTEIPAPILFLATFRDLDEALARRDAIPHRWSAVFGDDISVAHFLASPGSARGFLGVNALPREIDLIGNDTWAWLRYTRRVAGRQV